MTGDDRAGDRGGDGDWTRTDDGDSDGDLDGTGDGAGGSHDDGDSGDVGRADGSVDGNTAADGGNERTASDRADDEVETLADRLDDSEVDEGDCKVDADDSEVDAASDDGVGDGVDVDGDVETIASGPLDRVDVDSEVGDDNGKVDKVDDDDSDVDDDNGEVDDDSEVDGDSEGDDADDIDAIELGDGDTGKERPSADRPAADREASEGTDEVLLEPTTEFQPPGGTPDDADVSVTDGVDADGNDERLQAPTEEILPVGGTPEESDDDEDADDGGNTDADTDTDTDDDDDAPDDGPMVTDGGTREPSSTMSETSDATETTSTSTSTSTDDDSGATAEQATGPTDDTASSSTPPERTEAASTPSVDPSETVDPMVAVYRHDVHKMRGRAHESAAETYAGVRVNEAVPLGADADAALLSRPEGNPEQTVDNHASPYRLSLLTGEREPTRNRRQRSRYAVDRAIRDLIRIDEADQAHRAWLTAEVPAMFNESVYYPYTSLKYHTLLAAALLDAYRAGAAFEELFLVVDPPRDAAIVPHRTILRTDACTLRITADPGDRPAAVLGPAPARSFADVWSRLPEHPVATDDQRVWRVLDAQLRRIRSWSAALQFVENYGAWIDRKEREGW